MQLLLALFAALCAATALCAPVMPSGDGDELLIQQYTAWSVPEGSGDDDGLWFQQDQGHKGDPATLWFLTRQLQYLTAWCNFVSEGFMGVTSKVA